jgi:acyl-CoA synthetase (AMP-forming)/AMP-acid ligase II
MNTISERLTARGSPLEIVEATVEGVPCKVFRHAPRTLIDIFRRARSCGDREFLVSLTRRATFRDILRIAGHIECAIRRTLQEPEGARIAVMFDNVPEWIASFVAVTSLGATAVAVHRASLLHDIISAVETTDCAMVICDQEVASAFSAEVKGRPAVVIGPTGDSTPDLDDSGELMSWGEDLVLPDSVAMISFTSGSTGRPKGVELTHRSMTCGLMNTLLGGALASANPKYRQQATTNLPPTPFLAAPFSHVSGYGTALLSMYVGGRIVTMERWRPAGAVELMLAERTTSVIGATSQMLTELLQEEDLTGLGKLVRSVVVQGTSLPQSLLRKLKTALPEVSIGTGYGLTETNGSVCMGSEAVLKERPGTSGKALPTVDLKIRREDGQDAGPGEVGEVIIRGPMLMRGYASIPAATDMALRDGWFRTGDLGSLDADGFLYLTDRAEHCVICDGASIPYSALERAILDNRLTEEAFAFGAEEEGQTGAFLLVVSCAQGPCPDESTIIEALRRAGYGSMAPRIVRLSTSVPRTPSGKVDRRELRRRVFAGEFI